MKLKKLIIPATCFSMTLSTVSLSGVSAFAEEVEDSEAVERSVTVENETSEAESTTNHVEAEIQGTESNKFETNTIKTQTDGDTDNDDDKDTNVVKTDVNITIEGTSVKVPIKGNKWVNLKGYWHFVKDGELIKGWRNLTKADGESVTHYSYFDKTNGRLYTGWNKMGKAEGEKTEHWSYFGPNGWLRTGWHYMGTKTDPDGNNKAHWSYFGGNGWLVTGWKYLTKADGEKTAHFSYFGENGWLRTGWQSMGRGTANSFGENNAKHWSYFGNNGWLRTGMQTMATSTNPDGKNKIHLSYFGGNGWLVENNVFNYSNAQYIANTRGWVTKATTESDKTLVRAYQLVAKVTNSSMTKDQKLRACFDHIKNSYPEYNPRIPHVANKGWQTTYANDIFIKKGGNCASCAAAFAYMAKAIGYDNVYACFTAGTPPTHAWTEINGLIYDTEWERHHSGSYYGVSYNMAGTNVYAKYKSIFTLNNPYARVKI